MKKKTLTTLSSLGAISAVALFATSCGTSAAAKVDDGLISDFKHGDKTIGKVALDSFYKDLVANNQSETAKKVQDIIKKSARWLYEKEVKGSEHIKDIREAQMTKKEKEDADLKSLETIEDIEKSVKAEFDDQKEAFMQAHGHGYEEAWKTELSTNKTYGNATSDEQAKDNMVLKQLVTSAYARYTIKKDSDTWTKADVERGNPAKNDKDQKDWAWLWNLKKAGYVFSADKSGSYDSLENTQKVIVVSTGSFVVDKKNPSELIGKKGGNGYINQYDPMVVNHFLIPAVPDAAKTLAPWKVKMPDVKKWLMSIEKSTDKPKAAMDNLGSFEGLQYNKVKKDNEVQEFGVSDKDEALLKMVAGNQPSTQKTGGSLGLMDELSYIKGMDPGFGFPLLNDEMKGKGQFDIFDKNPLDGLGQQILNALQKEADGNPTFDGGANSKEWVRNLKGVLEVVGDTKAAQIVGRQFRDAFSVGRNNKERNVAYRIKSTTTGGEDKYVVASKFGVHIISKHMVTDSDELSKMLQSDVRRTTKGDSAYFKVISEINKYSSNKMLIVKSLLGNTDFIKWLKEQPNYNGKADGNDYPDYTQKDIDDIKNTAVKGYEKTLAASRANAATQGLRTWLDNAYKNQTIFAGKTGAEKIWTDSMDNIYDAAIAIAKEGAVK
ncbi:HinT-interacting membrane complex protein P80 [Mycoplasma todarodis]|uniref:Lipoprotein n=1 Tax=Mycoplasma todarodis TaxID=1937191 RepID=A0A4R0XJV3_9MOLU|nr:hypothetical protein [Mycoplasma todarodis]TCG10724.1 hypothetical protein C4B25_03210 [Mycoplasma todarodis]